MLKLLWTSEEPFDDEGRFYKVAGALSRRQPLQRPFPPLMNAGSSPTGQQFAAKHLDIAIDPRRRRAGRSAMPRSPRAATSHGAGTGVSCRSGASPT